MGTLWTVVINRGIDGDIKAVEFLNGEIGMLRRRGVDALGTARIWVHGDDDGILDYPGAGIISIRGHHTTNPADSSLEGETVRRPVDPNAIITDHWATCPALSGDVACVACESPL